MRKYYVVRIDVSDDVFKNGPLDVIHLLRRLSYDIKSQRKLIIQKQLFNIYNKVIGKTYIEYKKEKSNGKEKK